jgi:hypothetical protein
MEIKQPSISEIMNSSILNITEKIYLQNLSGFMKITANKNAMITSLKSLRKKYLQVSGTWTLGTFKPLFITNILS